MKNWIKSLIETVIFIPLFIALAIGGEIIFNIPKESTLIILALVFAFWGKSYQFWTELNGEKNEKSKV